MLVFLQFARLSSWNTWNWRYLQSLSDMSVSEAAWLLCFCFGRDIQVPLFTGRVRPPSLSPHHLEIVTFSNFTDTNQTQYVHTFSCILAPWLINVSFSTGTTRSQRKQWTMVRTHAFGILPFLFRVTTAKKGPSMTSTLATEKTSKGPDGSVQVLSLPGDDASFSAPTLRTSKFTNIS